MPRKAFRGYERTKHGAIRSESIWTTKRAIDCGVAEANDIAITVGVKIHNEARICSVSAWIVFAISMCVSIGFEDRIFADSPTLVIAEVSDCKLWSVKAAAIGK